MLEEKEDNDSPDKITPSLLGCRQTCVEVQHFKTQQKSRFDSSILLK